MSVHNDAWLAGMYEGEGTCVIYTSVVNGKPYRRATMRITSTDYDVLDKVLEVAGVGRISKEQRHNDVGGEHWKPFKAWEAASLHDVQTVLKRIRPYLLARRAERADEVLAMVPLDPSRPGRRGGRDPERKCRAGIHPMGGARYCRPCQRAKQKASV